MYPEQNSSNSQAENLSGLLFNHRRFAPWYDDRADYNTDAKSYYDYLARNNKLMDAIVWAINYLLRHEDKHIDDTFLHADWQPKLMSDVKLLGHLEVPRRVTVQGLKLDKLNSLIHTRQNFANSASDVDGDVIFIRNDLSGKMIDTMKVQNAGHGDRGFVTSYGKAYENKNKVYFHTPITATQAVGNKTYYMDYMPGYSLNFPKNASKYVPEQWHEVPNSNGNYLDDYNNGYILSVDTNTDHLIVNIFKGEKRDETGVISFGEKYASYTYQDNSGIYSQNPYQNGAITTAKSLYGEDNDDLIIALNFGWAPDETNTNATGAHTDLLRMRLDEIKIENRWTWSEYENGNELVNVLPNLSGYNNTNLAPNEIEGIDFYTNSNGVSKPIIAVATGSLSDINAGADEGIYGEGNVISLYGLNNLDYNLNLTYQPTINYMGLAEHDFIPGNLLTNMLNTGQYFIGKKAFEKLTDTPYFLRGTSNDYQLIIDLDNGLHAIRQRLVRVGYQSPVIEYQRYIYFGVNWRDATNGNLFMNPASIGEWSRIENSSNYRLALNYVNVNKPTDYNEPNISFYVQDVENNETNDLLKGKPLFISNSSVSGEQKDKTKFVIQTITSFSGDVVRRRITFTPDKFGVGGKTTEVIDL